MVGSNPNSFSSREKFWRWLIVGSGLSVVFELVRICLGGQSPVADCLIQAIVGVPCPACGTLRSLTALLRGNWLEALQYHLFAPFLLGISLSIFSQTSIELIQGRSLKGSSWFAGIARMHQWFLSQWVGLSIGILWLTYYGVRLYSRWYGSTLPIELADHPIWKLLTAKSLEL